jgi:hypothetical protein
MAWANLEYQIIPETDSMAAVHTHVAASSPAEAQDVDPAAPFSPPPPPADQEDGNIPEPQAPLEATVDGDESHKEVEAAEPSAEDGSQPEAAVPLSEISHQETAEVALDAEDGSQVEGVVPEEGGRFQEAAAGGIDPGHIVSKPHEDQDAKSGFDEQETPEAAKAEFTAEPTSEGAETGRDSRTNSVRSANPLTEGGEEVDDGDIDREPEEASPTEIDAVASDELTTSECTLPEGSALPPWTEVPRAAESVEGGEAQLGPSEAAAENSSILDIQTPELGEQAQESEPARGAIVTPRETSAATTPPPPIPPQVMYQSWSIC